MTEEQGKGQPGSDSGDEQRRVAEMQKRTEARIAEEAAKLKKGGNGHREITPAFVRQCLEANELGDGTLFCALHEGRYVFNKATKEWFVFNGQHWERDILDRSISAVEEVATCYMNEARRILEQIDTATKDDKKDKVKRLRKTQTQIYQRVQRLRADRGRTSCIKFAHTNSVNALAIEGDEFDTNPWMLACANGVVDLRSGMLVEGRPEDYLFKACPVEYRGIDEPAELWEKSLTEIFAGDKDMVAYMRRLFGYAITGLTVEHVLPILWGPKGRNGKGTVVETIRHVMGELAAPVSSEIFLAQRMQAGSSGPSPDILALRGLRIAFGSETEEGRRFSASKIKWLSGADTLVGRNPYDRYPTYFRPTHTLFLMTNDRPSAPPDDTAFWERVHLIPFEISFVNRRPVHEHERPADKYLAEKLKDESCGILAWLVRGCLEWQQHQGLDPPPAVQEATTSYRRDEDNLSDFIEDCCIVNAELSAGASELYAAFSEWWVENINKDTKRVPSQKAFGKMMTKRFYREKVGTYKYFGLGLK